MMYQKRSGEYLEYDMNDNFPKYLQEQRKKDNDARQNYLTSVNGFSGAKQEIKEIKDKYRRNNSVVIRDWSGRHIFYSELKERIGRL